MDLAPSPSVSASCCGSLLLTLKYFYSSACGRLAPLAPWTHFLHIFSVKWEWPACTEGLHCRFFLPSPEHFTLWNVFCSVCPSSGKTVTWREGKFYCLCSLLLSPFGWESPSCSVFCSVPMTRGHDSTYFGARHRIAVLIKFSLFPQRASVLWFLFSVVPPSVPCLLQHRSCVWWEVLGFLLLEWVYYASGKIRVCCVEV